MNSTRSIYVVSITSCLLASAIALSMVVGSSDGRAPWWFALGMALAVLNGMLVAYMIYQQWARGLEISGTPELISRWLTWATLAACAAMILHART